jgi:electron transfer flavoprotein alpha subunit
MQQVLSIGGFIDNPDQAIILYMNEAERDYYISNCPAKNILMVKIYKFCMEDAVDILEEILDYDCVVFPPNIFGKEMCVRLAYRLQGTSLTNIESMKENKFTKKVYSGYMDCEFNLTKKPIMISISKSIKSLEAISPRDNKVEDMDRTEYINSMFIIEESVEEVISKGLDKEKIIVAIGNGARSKEDIELVEELSKKINGVTGISRPVALSGIAPMEKLIGVSGTITSPSLCIALGVSGSPAFFAGIEKSDLIVAVNTDEKAPIFKLCDLGIVGDYKSFINELINICG